MGRLGPGVSILVLLLSLSGPVLGQEVSLRDTFEQTALLHGRSYAVGRDFLISKGDALRDLVSRKLRSEDWKERRLARVLALAAGAEPDGGDVAMALVDRLWADFRGVHGHDARLWTDALPALGEHGDLETARALLYMVEKGGLFRDDDVLSDTLIAMGESVAPALREAMGHPYWAPVPAARALGRFGGDENRTFLEKTLRNVTRGRHAEAICAALAEIGDPRSLPSLLECLVKCAGRGSAGSSEHVDYDRVRAAIFSYGKKAVTVLKQASAPAGSVPERFLAGGILHQIEHPDDGGAVERIAERAACGDMKAVDALSVCGDRGLAFDVIADALGRGIARVRPNPSRMVEMLGGIDGGRAVAYYATLSDDWRLRYFPDAIVRGILFGNEPAGIPLLDEIEKEARYGAERIIPEKKAPFLATAALAAAVRDVLTGGTHRLFDLLGHPEISVREAAALRILAAGDRRAIPALVKVAAEHRGPRNRFLVRKLLAQGPSGLPLYGKLASGAEDPLVRLLAGEVHTRLESPSLARALDEAMDPPPWRMHAPPDLGYYERTGHAVAEKVGPGAVALLESVAAFGGRRREILFAAFALSKLGQERSIPILLGAAKEERIGGAALGVALREFGPAGIEAAKSVPAPDPGRRAFEGRAGRHAGATRALVEEDDPEGVEKILAGLTVPPPEEQRKKRAWEGLCRQYLTLAGRYDDPRLLLAALAFVEENGDGYLHAALPVLSRRDDPKVEPHLLRTLRFPEDRERRDGLAAIRKHFGDGTIGKLLELLGTSKDGAMRCGAAWALGVLAGAGQKEEVVAPVRGKVIEPLLGALADGNPHLRRAAANALASIVWNQYSRSTLADRRPLKPLAAWLGRVEDSRDCWEVLRVFTESRDVEGVAALLDAYRKRQPPTVWMADALAELGRTEVIPDLVRWERLHSLARLGAPGHAELHRFFREAESIHTRARSLDLLREQDHRIPFEEVESRFRELMANAGWDPLLGLPADKRLDEMSYGFSAFAQGLAWLDRERAYPLVKLALLSTRHEPVRRGLEFVLARMEKAQPGLRDVPPSAGVASRAVEPAEIPFLDLCDIFRDAVAFGRDRGVPPFPEELVGKLAARGTAALRAAVELCYPRGDVATADEIAADVRSLGNPATRRDAVCRLALGIYPNRRLDAALAVSGEDALRYGLAVRRWRQQNDPWFVMHRRRLLAIATTLASSRLPPATVREYALTNLDRLARIDRRLETFLYYEPLAPILASIRMSSEPRERARLGDFLMTAEPAACLTAYYVTVRTINEGSGVWRELPDHDYSAEVLGAAALKVATYLTSSIHYERDALKFAFIYTPRRNGFDVLDRLREHPDEAVRTAANELRGRRR